MEQDEAKTIELRRLRYLLNSLVLNPTLLNASLSFQTENTKQNALVLSDNHDLSNKPGSSYFHTSYYRLQSTIFIHTVFTVFIHTKHEKLIKPNGKTI